MRIDIAGTKDSLQSLASRLSWGAVALGVALTAPFGQTHAAVIGTYGLATAGAIGGTSESHNFGHNTNNEPGQTLYLNPDTVTASSTATGGGASSMATASMGVLRTFATASFAGYAGGGGAGSRGEALAWDTVQVQTAGAVNFVIDPSGTSTGSLGGNAYGSLGGSTGTAFLLLYSDEFQSQPPLITLLYDANGTSNVLSGTVTLLPGISYYMRYGLDTEADVYGNFLDQGVHSATADFSHTLLIHLAPQVDGLGLSSGSGYDYVNVASVPEPTTYALFGIGLLGLGFIRRRWATGFA